MQAAGQNVRSNVRLTPTQLLELAGHTLRGRRGNKLKPLLGGDQGVLSQLNDTVKNHEHHGLDLTHKGAIPLLLSNNPISCGAPGVNLSATGGGLIGPM
eukprot:137574-Alexandrium_andersonii.AAC.1